MDRASRGTAGNPGRQLIQGQTTDYSTIKQKHILRLTRRFFAIWSINTGRFAVRVKSQFHAIVNRFPLVSQTRIVTPKCNALG